MEKQFEEKNTEMGSLISRSEEFIQQNQKTLIVAVAAIVLVVLAVFGVRKWYVQPRDTRASEAMFAAEQWFAQGDYDKALNGDETNMGFLGVIDDFGGTKAANLAKYYAGCAYMRIENYEEAIHWLKKYNGKDLFTGAEAEMLLGDAQWETGDAASAVKHYAAAAKKGNNAIVAPTALFKEGMAYLQLRDNAKALECFKAVKHNYPESSEWPEMDKWIAVAEAGE